MRPQRPWSGKGCSKGKKKMEEQKEVLNDGQQYIETTRNKKAQEIPIPEAAVNIAWGSCSHPKLPPWAVAPSPDQGG